MALVKHPHWYTFLRYSEPGKNGTPTTPFREMIKKMPGKAVKFEQIAKLQYLH